MNKDLQTRLEAQVAEYTKVPKKKRQFSETDRSWGMEEGVLISIADAKFILQDQILTTALVTKWNKVDELVRNTAGLKVGESVVDKTIELLSAKIALVNTMTAIIANWAFGLGSKDKWEQSKKCAEHILLNINAETTNNTKIIELQELLEKNGVLQHLVVDAEKVEIKLIPNFGEVMTKVFALMQDVGKIYPEYSVVKRMVNDEKNYELTLVKPK